MKIVLLLLILSSCFGQKATVEALSGRTMGTTYTVKYRATNIVPQKSELKTRIDQALIQVNRDMSTYDQDSNISRFNRVAAGKWFPIGPDFATVLKDSYTIYQKSLGKFDVTVGPLVRLWGFGPGGGKKVPTEEQIEKAKAKVGLTKLEYDINKRMIKKSTDGLELDFSAIAKGFGVDKVARVMENHQIHHYMIEIGGEIKVKGEKEEGKAWSIAIEEPSFDPVNKSVHKILAVNNMAMATSGNYRNYFKQKGNLFSHTIDPVSGRPVKNKLLSVTVLSEVSCTLADGWATALMALGFERAVQVAQQNNLATYFIYSEDQKTFKTYQSKRFFELNGGQK